MTFLSGFSIIIATIVCTLTITIQHSFHTLLYNQLKEFGADIIITPHYPHQFSKKHITFLNTIPEIKFWAPASWQYALVSKKNSNDFHITSIKLVDPTREKHVLFQKKNILISNTSQSEILSNGVIIGSGLQEKLDILLNDTIEIMSLDIHTHIKRKKTKMKAIMHNVKVNGFLSTGIQDIDDMIIVCSYEYAQQIFSDTSLDSITISLTSEQMTIPVAEKLRTHYPELHIKTFKETHPTFIAAMTLENYVTYLYLILLLLFVEITQSALFLMHMMYNQSKIIILNLLGIGTMSLYLFTICSVIIQTICATIIGIICAYGIAQYITNHTPQDIQNAYHITHLPIEFSYSLIGTIVLIMSGVALLTGLLIFILLYSRNNLYNLKCEK